MTPGVQTIAVVLVNLVFWGLQVAIILHALASWLPQWQWRRPKWLRPIDAIVEPMLRPIRRLLNRHSASSGIDVSPLLLLIAIMVAHHIIMNLLFHRI